MTDDADEKDYQQKHPHKRRKFWSRMISKQEDLISKGLAQRYGAA
jgi:hypothetical protein